MPVLYPLSFTPGVNAKSSVVRGCVQIDWDEFVTMPPEADGKPKEAYDFIFPSRFEPAVRNEANCRELWAARFDVDKETVEEGALRSVLSEFQAVAWTSFSSTPEAPRWCVWIVLERVPTKEEYAATVRDLCSRIPGASTGQTDMSRARIVPVARPGFRRFVTEGRPLKVLDAPAAAPWIEKAKADPLWDRVGQPDVPAARAIMKAQGFPKEDTYELRRLLARTINSAGFSPWEALSFTSEDGGVEEKWVAPMLRSAVSGGVALNRHWPAATIFLAALGIVPFGSVEAELLKPKPAAIEVPDTPANLPPLRVKDPKHEYSYHPTFIAATDLRKTNHTSVMTALISLPDWEGVLRWNSFSNRAEAIDPPLALDAEKGMGISKNDLTLMRSWFAWKLGVSVKEDDMRAAAQAAAKAQSYHPVHDYFAALPVLSREQSETVLGGLAGRLFGAVDQLEEVFLRKFLIQAVMRILEPGCKADSALTLYEADGGMKKTMFVRVLFSSAWSAPYGKTTIGDIESARKLVGKWCLEVAEMAAMRNAQVEDVKAFMTTEADWLRDMHDATYYDRKRECVLICTTNDKNIFHDDAHERRFWVIEVRKMIDVEYLAKHRDLIWAAALSLALSGEQYWLTEQEKGIAKVGLKEFRDLDAWSESIAVYCQGKDTVKVSAVWAYLSKAEEGSLDKVKEMRITSVLKRLGAKKGTNGIYRYWIVPEFLAKAKPADTPNALAAKLKQN